MDGDFCVITDYFGKFDCRNHVCYTDSLSNALLIADLLIEHFSGRPFKISIVYIGSDLEDVLESFCYDGERELNEYFNGIYCLNNNDMLL